MEARSRAESTGLVNLASPAVQAVLGWPELRGEPKVAWLGLWTIAGCRPGSVRVSATLIGTLMGTSERSGSRALSALKDEGLLEVQDTRGGRWTAYVPDPLEVERVRGVVRDDRQGSFWADEQVATDAEEQDVLRLPPRAGMEASPTAPHPPTRESSADVTAAVPAPQPPADVAPLPPNAEFAGKNASAVPAPLPPPCDFEDLIRDLGDFDPHSNSDLRPRRSAPPPERRTAQDTSAKSRAQPDRGGSGATSAGGPMDSVLLQVAGSMVARIPSPAQRAAQIDAFIRDEIEPLVGDVRLRDRPKRRVARAVCEGELSDTEWDRFRRYFRANRGTFEFPWRVFVTAMKRRFHELGINWQD